MTRYAPLWQQNSTYPAATDRGLLGTLWPSSGSTGAAVSVVSGTMNVSIAVGTAAVAMGANLTQLCRWDVAEVVTLAAAPPSGNSRIDLIILQVRDAAVDGGGNNDFLFQAIAGTPATSNPATPAVPTNAYALAQVLVPGAAANLNGATLTDRRVPMNSRDVLHAQVRHNAALSISTTAVAIPYDTVDRNPSGLWVPAQNAFVVPVAGVYQVLAQHRTGIAGNVVTPYINGTNPRNSYNDTGGIFAGSFYLNAADVVQIRISAATTGALVGGNAFNYCSFDYLGTG